MLEDNELKTIEYELMLRSYFTPDNKKERVKEMNYGIKIHVMTDMFPDTIPEVVFDQLVSKLKEDLMLRHVITKELPFRDV